MGPESVNARRLRIGRWIFDPESGEVALPGRSPALRLRPRSARLLRYLAERPGQLVARQELQQLLWGDRLVDAEQGLNACVRDVRRVFGDRAVSPQVIETLPGRGYRLIAPVAAAPVANVGQPRRPPPGLVSVVAGVALLTGVGLWWLAAQEPRAPDREVHRLVLEAEHLTGTGEAAALVRSQQLLEEAIARDARFAPAHGQLALVRFLAGDVEHARRSAERALALDPRLAEAHAAVGFLDFYQGRDPERAEHHLRRAVRLDPASPTARHTLAHFLVVSGRPGRAVEAMEVALDLDPADARLRGDAAWIFYWARRFPEAADHARRTLVLVPDDRAAHVCLFRSLVADGRIGAAADVLAELSRGGDLPDEIEATLVEGSAEQRLRRYWHGLAEATSPSPRRVFALAQLRRAEEARQDLERLARTLPPIDHQHLLLDPLLDPIRDQIPSKDHRNRG